MIEVRKGIYLPDLPARALAQKFSSQSKYIFSKTYKTIVHLLKIQNKTEEFFFVVSLVQLIFTFEVQAKMD